MLSSVQGLAHLTRSPSPISFLTLRKKVSLIYLFLYLNFNYIFVVFFCQLYLFQFFFFADSIWSIVHVWGWDNVEIMKRHNVVCEVQSFQNQINSHVCIQHAHSLDILKMIFFCWLLESVLFPFIKLSWIANVLKFVNHIFVLFYSGH